MTAKGDIQSRDKYQIKSHGVDVEQYFPAADATSTSFDTTVTGIGSTEAEAYNSAVDQLAYGCGDALVAELGLPDFWGDEDRDVCEDCESNGDVAGCDLECERHYYVDICFNFQEEAESHV